MDKQAIAFLAKHYLANIHEPVLIIDGLPIMVEYAYYMLIDAIGKTPQTGLRVRDIPKPKKKNWTEAEIEEATKRLYIVDFDRRVKEGHAKALEAYLQHHDKDVGYDLNDKLHICDHDYHGLCAYADERGEERPPAPIKRDDEEIIAWLKQKKQIEIPIPIE